jgi:hypothetical protein
MEPGEKHGDLHHKFSSLCNVSSMKTHCSVMYVIACEEQDLNECKKITWRLTGSQVLWPYLTVPLTTLMAYQAEWLGLQRKSLLLLQHWQVSTCFKHAVGFCQLMLIYFVHTAIGN